MFCYGFPVLVLMVGLTEWCFSKIYRRRELHIWGRGIKIYSATQIKTKMFKIKFIIHAQTFQESKIHMYILHRYN